MVDSEKKQSSSLALNRIPPNSKDAEMAALGAMLLDSGETAAIVRDRLSAQMFYYAAHQAVFREITTMLDGMNAVDLVTLTTRLQAKGLLEEVGGPAYLTELVTQVPSTANVEQYVEIVEEKHQRRQLIGLGHNLVEGSFDETQSLDDIQKILSQSLGIIGSNKTNITDMREAVKNAMEQIEAVASSERHITGLSTGFSKLDEYTFGLNAPDVWIIGGRPSDGKTALSCAIAANVANIEKTPVGFISLEQSTTALAKRILASWSRVNMRKLRFLTDQESSTLTDMAGKLMKLPIYFDDRPALSASQIRSAARVMHRQYGCRLFILDYLQLSHADERTHSKNDEVSKISAAIKATAKELDAPFIVLSQLSRKGDSEHGRPNLTTLRDSGAIEQDADVVIFVNRDLDDDELPQHWQNRYSERELACITQLDIAKQREGERDVAVYLRFDKEFTLFSSMDMRVGDLTVKKDWTDR